MYVEIKPDTYLQNANADIILLTYKQLTFEQTSEGATGGAL